MKAAVLHAPNQPLTIEEVALEKPRSREVVLRTAFAGLCHSDLHFIEGLYPTPTPVVLGHESRRLVEAVGDGRQLCQARRPRHHLPFGVLRQLFAMRYRPPQSLREHRRQVDAGQGPTPAGKTTS